MLSFGNQIDNVEMYACLSPRHDVDAVRVYLNANARRTGLQRVQQLNPRPVKCRILKFEMEVIQTAN